VGKLFSVLIFVSFYQEKEIGRCGYEQANVDKTPPSSISILTVITALIFHLALGVAADTGLRLRPCAV